MNEPAWGPKTIAPAWPSVEYCAMPLLKERLARKTHHVRTVEDAGKMVAACQQMPISVVGLDTEYRFAAEEPLVLKGGSSWWDIRSVQPFCVAFAVMGGGTAIRFCVDLRKTGLFPHVAAVLSTESTFVAHNAKVDLFALWSLGLPEPARVWDTYVAERCLAMGRLNFRAREATKEAITAEQSEQKRRDKNLSLDAIAQKYGFATARGGVKHGLQTSFLSKPHDDPLTATEMDYCAADAERAAQIYSEQRRVCDEDGVTPTLDRVVMDWVTTCAEIEWNGVQLNRPLCAKIVKNSAHAKQQITTQLNGYGLENPASTKQISDWLIRQGLDGYFPKTPTGNLKTDDDTLKDREGMSPAIPLIRRFKKLGSLAADPAVLGKITGVDGRVHATIKPIAADTGRTQSSRPNLMGLGRVFRPLVVAPPGRALFDVDLSQIEVGVAAAVFGDEELIRDYNEGDCYAAMAKRVFRGQLSPADLLLSDKLFKARHKKLRDRVKPLWLGVIYGMHVQTIAANLDVLEVVAKGYLESFRNTYPTLFGGMERARRCSLLRGYANAGGLRRLKSETVSSASSEGRALGNACVQGAAALVFYAGVNRCRKLLRAFGARVVLPVHDAVLVECPADAAQEAARLVERTLVDAVQERYPALRPRATANLLDTRCWNSEGASDSVERFLEDPSYCL